MIKLFSLKQQKKDEESAGANRAGAGGKKASAAQLRIQKGRHHLHQSPYRRSPCPAETWRLENPRLREPASLGISGCANQWLLEPADP